MSIGVKSIKNVKGDILTHCPIHRFNSFPSFKVGGGR